jgi:hypothetical protein
MFRFQEFTPNMAVILQMGLIGVWSSRRVRDLVKANHSLTSIMGNDAIFEFYTVSSLLIAGFTFYIQMGFYRTFTPAILMIFLLMIARRDYRHLVTLLTINILFVNSYMFFYARIGDFEIVRSDYSTAAPALSEIGAQIDEFVAYDPKAKNPWCNTVLIPLNFYDWRIMMFPPGFGVSYIPKKIETLQFPIRSRYAFLDDPAYEALKDGTILIRLASTQLGTLYLNEETDCSKTQ